MDAEGRGLQRFDGMAKEEASQIQLVQPKEEATMPYVTNVFPVQNTP